MPCDYTVPAGKTPAQRKSDVKDALARLERALMLGEARAVVGPRGSVTFAGKWDRDGVSDACAYRRLTAAGSSALRMAIARAEALAGRQVDKAAVASGEHSHDGGHTWHPGHKK